MDSNKKGSVFFSIVTVCYNSEKFIEGTIESVLSQNFKGYEYIIIDGKSTDKTLIKIKSYQNNHKSIALISEEDNGIYDAMNKGIKQSKGEYIFFLNAGDAFYDSDTLEKTFHLIDKNDEIIYGDICQVNGEKEVYKKSIKKITKFHLLLDRMICHQAIFAKRSIFNNHGLFDIRYKISADYDWFISCFKAGVKLKYIPLVISYFDMSGISTSNNIIIQKEHEDIIKNQFGKVVYRFSRFKHWIGNRLKKVTVEKNKNDKL
jgi:glycosyltransferase involved in cell wall biosynthesis